MGVPLTIALLVFVWSVLAGRLERLDVTGPIIFVLAGLACCNGPTGFLDVSIDTEGVQLIVEITLGLLLFADASRIDPRDLRRNAGLPARLLAIGLPLTVALGAGLAAALFTDLPWQLAALLGAVLAPTDAALSAAVISDPRVDEGIRRSLNVESGLNDGLATPVVTASIAAAATILGTGALADTASGPGWSAIVDVVGAAAIGAGVGWFGGTAVARARAAGWIAPGGRRIAVLMLAVLAFTIAAQVDANYFVAAFVAGLGLRGASGHDDAEATELPELLGRVLSLAVWFLFGAALLADGLARVDWRIAVYAVLSLTIVRLLSVGVAMAGTGASGREVLFVGWFGPRGLATVVFGLLIVEELPVADSGVRTVLATIVLTVVLSVLAHGATARPVAGWMSSEDPEGGSAEEVTGPRSPFGRTT
jgi:NhaP-type Na+/H+ or K+/H+ antiporter